MANGANLSSKLPIVVAGPTGVGKSAFAVDLANELDGEIIGADAYQVYRGLEILTGQPTSEMLSAVPHHLIGFLPPTEVFDAGRFATIVREKISEVLSRGKVPIVTGGSGLYIKALTHGLVDVPPANPALRSELASLSPRQLQERLAKIDPAARIDFQNPRRVLRALEISILTGRPASEMRRGWEGKAALGFRGLLLVRERKELQARIAENVRGMFERGVARGGRQDQSHWCDSRHGNRPQRYPGSAARRNHRGRVHRCSYASDPAVRQKTIDLVPQSVYVPNHRLDRLSRHARNPSSRLGIPWCSMMADSTSRPQEKAILVGLEREGVSRWDVEDSLTELRQLAATAGAQVVDTVVQKLEKPTAPFYIGKGKAEEVARRCGEKHVTSLIFDDELSPPRVVTLSSSRVARCWIAPSSSSIFSPVELAPAKVGSRSNSHNCNISFHV